MDKNDLIYSLWINCVCGHSPLLISKCMKTGIKPKDIFDGKADESLLRRALGIAVYGKLQRRDLSEAEEILDYCTTGGIRILSIDDKQYPELLRNINEPPNILYTKGEELDLNDFLTITIVGSRHCSKQGIKFTHKLSYELAANGVIIVSGMAEGLDAAAHIGALAAKQKSVAVLAGGVERIYPKKNDYIYEAILDSGMIVSERPPLAVGTGEYYRERNRIIAGLSYGTIVVEGGVRSGTSITAGLAEEFNRDLFAVPGSPESYMSHVPNALLRDRAILTLSAKDVIQEYEDVYPHLFENGKSLLPKSVMDFENVSDEFKKFGVDVKYSAAKQKPNKKIKQQDKIDGKINYNKNNAKPSFDKFNEQERLVLECLYKHGDLTHIDEIINETEISSPAVNSIMIMLQMKGAVRQNSGNLYILAI